MKKKKNTLMDNKISFQCMNSYTQNQINRISITDKF